MRRAVASVGSVIIAASALVVPVTSSRDTWAAVGDARAIACPVEYRWRVFDKKKLGGVKKQRGLFINDAAVTAGGDVVLVGEDLWARKPLRTLRFVGERKWRSSALPGGKKGTSAGQPRVSRIMSTPDGLVALGAYGPDKRPNYGLIWEQADGRWRQPQRFAQAALVDIALGPDGVVVLGDLMPKGRGRIPAIWTPDGSGDWRVTEIGPPSKHEARFLAIGRGGGPWLVQNRIFKIDLEAEEAGPKSTRLWRSEDGRSWSRVALPGGYAEDASVWLNGPWATTDGFVLTTTDRTERMSTVWWSADGLSWSEVDTGIGQTADAPRLLALIGWPPRLTHLAPASDGVESGSTIVISTDGQEWCAIEGPEVGTGESVQNGVAAAGGLIVMEGFRSRPKWSELVWIGDPVANGPEG